MGQTRKPKGKHAVIRDRISRSRGKLKGHYLASCHGKIRFESYEQAKGAAESLGSGARAYRCRYFENQVHYHRGRKSSK